MTIKPSAAALAAFDTFYFDLADKGVVLIDGEEISRAQLERLFEPNFAAALWSVLVNTAGKAVQ
jgi:hypothetical protein